MTDDELDLLASAYLDGEATSEEVAMVERDRELLARVEEMRSVAEQVSVPVAGPDPSVKEQHLAAALATFGTAAPVEEATPTGGETGAPVIDLSERAKRSRSATPTAAGGAEPPSRSMPGRSMPRWLTAAAALLIVGGGGALLISQGVGSNDLGETADAGSDTEESAGDASDDAMDELATEAGTANDAPEAESVMADEAMADDAVEEDAMEEEEAMEDEALEDDEEASDADRETTAAPAEGDDSGGFFPDEPVLFFDTVPDPDQVLQELDVTLRTDPTAAACVDSAIVLSDGPIMGYLPIEVAGAASEFFVFANAAGAESAVIFDAATCAQIAP